MTRRVRFSLAIAVVVAGRAHFADHCAVCHGNEGSGKTAFGAAMYPRVPDLRGGMPVKRTPFRMIEKPVFLRGEKATTASHLLVGERVVVAYLEAGDVRTAVKVQVGEAAAKGKGK